MTSILAFLFVLGVLIFVHELGHFMMARRIGVRVITFSLGFGPKILSFRRGDTEYCVSAIPLGGYVKMAGETPEDARTGSSDEFLSKSKWQRFQVLVMGPVMNLALAVIVMALVLLQGAKLPAFDDYAVVVGGLAPGSPAEAAGLQPGDRIVSADDKDISTWKQFYMATATRANRPVRIVVERDGKRIERQLVPVAIDRYETGAVGVLPVMHPQIDSLQKGQPGEEGGLQKGDFILAAGGPDSMRVAPEDLAELSSTHVRQHLRRPRRRPRAHTARRSDSGARGTSPGARCAAWKRAAHGHRHAAQNRRGGAHRRPDYAPRAQDRRAGPDRSRSS